MTYPHLSSTSSKRPVGTMMIIVGIGLSLLYRSMSFAILIIAVSILAYVHLGLHMSSLRYYCKHAIIIILIIHSRVSYLDDRLFRLLFDFFGSDDLLLLDTER